MPENPIAALRLARESFVRKRRAMVEQMIPAGAAASHFAPRFVDLQNAIEAIDRALADEAALPDGYAAAESEAVRSGEGAEASNVVDVDFDQA